MKGVSCKRRLLEDGFKGLYKVELPIEDKDLFIFVMGLNITKLATQIASETIKLKGMFEAEFLAEMNGSVEKRRIKLIKNCCDLTKEYICEVKGFKGGRFSKDFNEWFKHMSNEYEKNKVTWHVLIQEKGCEFIKLINDIVAKELLEKK